jgi:hypothetical protein
VKYLDEFLGKPTHQAEARRLGIEARRNRAVAELKRVTQPAYLSELEGTLGADPIS